MDRRARAPLVGRDAELAVLDEVLDGLAAGGSPTLVVSGEPGIGKTRLLEELGIRAGDRGAAVRSGRAAEYEMDLPLAVWTDAHGDALEDATVRGAAERQRAHVARALLADLARERPRSSQPCAGGRHAPRRGPARRSRRSRLRALRARPGLPVPGRARAGRRRSAGADHAL